MIDRGEQFFNLIRAKSSEERSRILSVNDKEFSDRRNQLYRVIESLVAQQRLLNPKFYLTTKTLSQMIKDNPNLFGNLKSVSSVLYYWGHEINPLKEKLGFLITRKSVFRDPLDG